MLLIIPNGLMIMTGSYQQKQAKQNGPRRNALKKLKNLFTSKTLDKTQKLHTKKQRYIALTSALDAMSPLKVLTRGYAMTQDLQGNVIRSVKQVRAGEDIHVQFSDGSACAKVYDVEVSANGK